MQAALNGRPSLRFGDIMTRETKIGLLVGLAFIIVIGILLSDHINTSTDPIRADATGIFGSVEKSVDAPESRQKGITDVVMPPQPVVPRSAVPTVARNEQAVDNGTVINVSPGKDPSNIEFPTRSKGVVALSPADTQNPDNITDPNANPPANTTVATNASPFTGQDTVTNDIQKAALNGGEQIVSPDGKPVGISTGPIKSNVVPQPAGRQVKAEEGDNVSKLALKYMGANTRANREAIIKANPTMTPDGHLVFAGRAYTIPAAGAQAPTPAAPTVPVAVTPKPTPAPESGNVYTVKENDTLWKIASAQLGSGVRWEEIKQLNSDVLKGGEQVRVGMRLKLPNKSVASAN
jgi:nucleoid-associated protein YgaU